MADVPLSDARAHEALDSLSSLRRHQRDGRRSRHEPLLVLLALGRLAANGTNTLPWTETEQLLADLPEKFGPTSTTCRAQSAACPFTHPRSGAVRTLDEDVPMDRVGPLRNGMTGRLEASLERALKERPPLLDEAARTLVEARVPATVGPDVLVAVGLDPELLERSPGTDREDPEEQRLVVAQRFSARTPSGRSLYDLHGHRRQPRRGTPLPAEPHVAWHREQVLQGPALVG